MSQVCNLFPQRHQWTQQPVPVSFPDSINKCTLQFLTCTQRDGISALHWLNAGGTMTVSESHIFGPRSSGRTHTHTHTHTHTQLRKFTMAVCVCRTGSWGFQYFINYAAHYRFAACGWIRQEELFNFNLDLVTSDWMRSERGAALMEAVH